MQTIISFILFIHNWTGVQVIHYAYMYSNLCMQYFPAVYRLINHCRAFDLEQTYKLSSLISQSILSKVPNWSNCHHNCDVGWEAWRAITLNCWQLKGVNTHVTLNCWPASKILWLTSDPPPPPHPHPTPSRQVKQGLEGLARQKIFGQEITPSQKKIIFVCSWC